MSDLLGIRNRKLKKNPVYRFRAGEQYKRGTGKPPKSQDLWQGFKDFTTAHGVPHIDRSKGSIKRIFWSVCLLCCSVGFMYNFVMLAMLYADFRVSVRVQLLHSREMHFPAITICNTNPVKSSAVYRSPRLVALLESWGVTLHNGTGEGSRRKRDVNNMDSYDTDIMDKLNRKSELVHTFDGQLKFYEGGERQAVAKSDITNRKGNMKKLEKLAGKDANMSEILPENIASVKHRVRRSFTSDTSCDNLSYISSQYNLLSGSDDADGGIVTSYQECLALCDSTPGCKSFDYEAHSNQQCYVSYSDQWSASLTQDDNWDYYEECSGCNSGHPTPANSNRECGNSFPNWSATYTCTSGMFWSVTGTASLTIQCNCETETWGTLSEICEVKNDCIQDSPDLAIFNLAKVNTPEWTHGEIQDYSCMFSYTFYGTSNQAICWEGNWEWYPLTSATVGLCSFPSSLTLYTKPVVYKEAVRKCRMRRGNIVVINSVIKLQRIKNLLQCRYEMAWIGLSYDIITEEWKWYTGETLKFKNWQQRQPVHFMNEEYCVRVTSKDARWVNAPCLRRYPYICEGVKKNPCHPSPCSNGYCCSVDDQAQCICEAPHYGEWCEKGQIPATEITTLEIKIPSTNATSTVITTTTSILQTSTVPTSPLTIISNATTTTIDTEHTTNSALVSSLATRRLTGTSMATTTSAISVMMDTITRSASTSSITVATEQTTGGALVSSLATRRLAGSSMATSTSVMTNSPSPVITTSAPDDPTTAVTTAEETTAEQTTTTTTTTTTTSLTPTSAPSTTTSPTQTVPSRFTERNENPLREDFKKEEDIMRIFADLDEDTKRELGYTWNDLMIDCQYEGRNCDESDFDYFFDATHGNCYVFNARWNGNKTYHYSRRAGRRFGLKVVINIGQYEYLEGVGEAAGAVVVVHTSDRMPFPEDEGVLAVPGAATAIGVRMVEVKRLPLPYGVCVDNTHANYSRNVFEEKYPTKYSSNACFKTCYQRYVISNCGCGDPQYPMYGQAFSTSDIVSCDIRNITQDDCKYEMTQKYINDELDCDCPNPCHETAFVHSVSSMRWPADKYETNIINSLGQNLDALRARNDSSEFRRNLIKLEIYFEEFNYEKIEEFPTYTLSRFFSDVGGILGLWIGCSILSIAEFVELIMDLIVLGCYKAWKKPYLGSAAAQQSTNNTPSVNSDILEDIEPENSQSNTNKHDKHKASKVHNLDKVTPPNSAKREQPTHKDNRSKSFLNRRNSLSFRSENYNQINLNDGITTSGRSKNEDIAMEVRDIGANINTKVIQPSIINITQRGSYVSRSSTKDKSNRLKHSLSDPFHSNINNSYSNPSYIIDSGTLTRRPLSSSLGRGNKTRNNEHSSSYDTEAMPPVEGGLRANVNILADDADSVLGLVRRSGQIADPHPPFAFI